LKLAFWDNCLDAAVDFHRAGVNGYNIAQNISTIAYRLSTKSWRLFSGRKDRASKARGGLAGYIGFKINKINFLKDISRTVPDRLAERSELGRAPEFRRNARRFS
jgi:hypothetical protein